MCIPVPPPEHIMVLPDGFEPTPVRGLSSMPLPRLGYGSKLISYSNVSDIRENNKRKLTASALRNIIYNDYTNLNTVLIDKYEV